MAVFFSNHGQTLYSLEALFSSSYFILLRTLSLVITGGDINIIGSGLHNNLVEKFVANPSFSIS